METIDYGKIPDSWFGSHFDLEWPLLHHGMCLVFQKKLLFHTNILIPNTHPYVWFKLKFGLRVMSVLKCLHYPYTYYFDHRGAFFFFTYIGVFKTWSHKKDVHHFWRLHPPLQYAPSVGLKHDTNENFLTLGLTWIPKMGGWLMYYTNTANFYPFSQYFHNIYHDLFDLSWPLNDLLVLMNQNMCILKKCK